MIMVYPCSYTKWNEIMLLPVIFLVVGQNLLQRSRFEDNQEEWHQMGSFGNFSNSGKVRKDSYAIRAQTTVPVLLERKLNIIFLANWKHPYDMAYILNMYVVMHFESKSKPLNKTVILILYILVYVLFNWLKTVSNWSGCILHAKNK